MLRRDAEPIANAHRRLARSLSYFCVLLAMPLFFLFPHIWKVSHHDAMEKHRLRAERITNSVNKVITEYQRRFAHEPTIEEVVENVVKPELHGSVVNATGSLIVRRGRAIVEVFPPRPEVGSGLPRRLYNLPAATSYGQPGSVLYESALAEPLADYTLTFTATAVPESAAAFLARIDLLSLILICISGPIAIYRSGREQLRLVEQQQRFLSAVSHELKTPVAGMRLCAEMLRNQWVQDPTRAREYIDHIARETERLSRLTENVLSLSRDGSRQATHSEPLPCREIIKRAMDVLKPICVQAGFELRLSFNDAATEGAVLANEDIVVQILTNLVENAVKHARDATLKEIEIRVEVGTDQLIKIAVCDYGPGIAPHETSLIFEPFSRGAAAVQQNRGGLGLGLALVRELTTMIGGTIGYAREGGKSAFVLGLRRAALTTSS